MSVPKALVPLCQVLTATVGVVEHDMVVGSEVVPVEVLLGGRFLKDQVLFDDGVWTVSLARPPAGGAGLHRPSGAAYGLGIRAHPGLLLGGSMSVPRVLIASVRRGHARQRCPRWF